MLWRTVTHQGMEYVAKARVSKTARVWRKNAFDVAAPAADAQEKAQWGATEKEVAWMMRESGYVCSCRGRDARDGAGVVRAQEIIGYNRTERMGHDVQVFCRVGVLFRKLEVKGIDLLSHLRSVVTE